MIISPIVLDVVLMFLVLMMANSFARLDESLLGTNYEFCVIFGNISFCGVYGYCELVFVFFLDLFFTSFFIVLLIL